MVERLRLFAAIPTPDSWRPLLQQECTRLGAAAPAFGRWTSPDGWHVTLAFLGYQPSTLVPTIAEVLEDAAASHAAFTLRLSHIGCFRRGRHVSVIWAGLNDEPKGSLARLRANVVEQLAAAKIEFERGPFSPHLTMARARRDATDQDSDMISEAIESGSAWASETETECAEVLLFKSDRRPTGAVYTVLHRARLRGTLDSSS